MSDFIDINEITDYVVVSYPCQGCVHKFITCKICNGYFKPDFYNTTHKNICGEIYKYEQEKSEYVECGKCNCLIKLNDYSQHIDNCQKKDTVDCTYCKKAIPLNVLEEHEGLCEKSQTDLTLLKEKLECTFCKQNIPMIHIEEHEKGCKKFHENQDKIKQELSNESIQYPKEWNIQGAVDKTSYTLVPLGGEEYWMVRELYDLTCNKKVSNIWRIQNCALWENYYREKLRIKQEKGFIEEKLLFFANKTVKIEHIQKNGFDISFANDNQSYGRGIYFNRRADKVLTHAYKYDKKQKFSYIFLSTVLVGVAYLSEASQSYRKPPFYDESKFIYHDSVTNIENFSDLKEADQIFVVYNNEKAYPSYMIEIIH
jgi:hypothetical protein